MTHASSSHPQGPMGSVPPDSTSRYELLEKIAAGGMATVYVGRQRGAEGFWRLVAIKRPHQHLLDDVAFRRMFVDEARLASRIHHPNVVPVLDVEERPGGQLLLVMDYVEGASLAELIDAAGAAGEWIPARNAVRIALDALAGLHAAHELCDPAGRPLRMVHRDVSPHNVLVGVDGTGRVADFGIAKSVSNRNVTESGVLKGKLAYMAPEYVEKQICDARSDVFAMAIVLWESIAGKRLFRGDSDYDTLRRIVKEEAPLLSTAAPWTEGVLDAVIAAALERDPSRRTPTARAFAEALESVARRHDLVATPGEVGDHLRRAMEGPLGLRREKLRKFLDAGGTTGPMDAAHVEVARATPMIATPAPPTILEVAPRVEPAEDLPHSSAVTSAGSELTERALVAAGIRAPRSSTGVLTLAAIAAVAGIVGLLWLRGRDAPEVPGAAAPSFAAPADPRSGSSTAPPPRVEPMAAPPPEPAAGSAAAIASAAPSASAAPPVRPPSAAPQRPPNTAAPARPAPPTPRPSPTGPLRDNPYR